jgi:hypothetical protein
MLLTWHPRPPELSPSATGRTKTARSSWMTWKGSSRRCKELDTYSPMDCEPGVKRKMADCRLRLEAARFEAEKVVTRLLRDHEAWGQVSREGRPQEKAPDTRMEPQSRREADNPAEKAMLVRFGSLRLERNDAGAGEPEEDRPRSSKGTREGRHATSTPTGSDREQRLKGGTGGDLRYPGRAPAPSLTTKRGVSRTIQL